MMRFSRNFTWESAMSRSKPRSFRAIVALLAIIMASVASADAIDDLVKAELASSKTPGIAVLVMRDGKVLKEQGYGYANLEHRVPVTPETIFQSGSTAKQFTAAGILLLAEEGKLSLDDRLSRYFSDGPASWHRITIRHLLTHTSGLRDYGDEFDYRKDYTEAELLAVMKTLPLDFEPGSQWSYSNSGYLVLGLLTSKLSGMHWSDYQAEKIFKPLGMRTTKVISEKDLVAHRAAGYQLDDDGAIVNQDWIAPSFNRLADGALYFSLRDLAAWERALNQRALLSDAHYTDWWTPVRLSSGARVPYGFGWSFGEQRGQPVIQHGGSWQGFRATVTRYPSEKLAVFVLANAAHAQPEALSHAIAGLVDASLAQRPKAAVQPSGKDEGLADSLRDVLSAWASYGSSERMAPEMVAIASGSVREASDRLRVSRHLSAAKSVTIIGSDSLSEAAMDLLDDRSVRAVDALLDTGGEQYMYRFRIDDQDRVVDFSRR
jgi:CubicO group peptidase (beta-lactamase class C family)